MQLLVETPNTETRTQTGSPGDKNRLVIRGLAELNKELYLERC